MATTCPKYYFFVKAHNFSNFLEHFKPLKFFCTQIKKINVKMIGWYIKD